MLNFSSSSLSFSKYNKGFMRLSISIYQQFLYLCITILLTYPELVFAGAGGTSGKNSDGGIILALLILPIALGIMTFKKLLKNYAQRAAMTVIKSAQKRDKLWNIKYIRTHVKKSFKNLQELWSNNNIEGSKTYLHPHYADIYLEKLKLYDLRGEFNKISKIKIKNISIVMAKDFEDPNQDMFVAHIEGKMHDEFYDDIGFQLRTNGDEKNNPQREIDEYWHFQRLDGKWLLLEISQDHAINHSDISIDSPSIEKKNLSESKRNEEIANASQKAKISQRQYYYFAFMVGLLVTIAGYISYYLLFDSILKLIKLI